jgi:hypothetical protein
MHQMKTGVIRREPRMFDLRQPLRSCHIRWVFCYIAFCIDIHLGRGPLRKRPPTRTYLHSIAYLPSPSPKGLLHYQQSWPKIWHFQMTTAGTPSAFIAWEVIRAEIVWDLIRGRGSSKRDIRLGNYPTFLTNHIFWLYLLFFWGDALHIYPTVITYQLAVVFLSDKLNTLV